MRHYLLLLVLFLFSACTTTPEVCLTTAEESQSKILANQSDAQQAKDEYKKLQAQREKE